jgi:hypothetical protein
MGRPISRAAVVVNFKRAGQARVREPPVLASPVLMRLPRAPATLRDEGVRLKRINRPDAREPVSKVRRMPVWTDGTVYTAERAPTEEDQGNRRRVR